MLTQADCQQSIIMYKEKWMCEFVSKIILNNSQL